MFSRAAIAFVLLTLMARESMVPLAMRLHKLGIANTHSVLSTSCAQYVLGAGIVTYLHNRTPFIMDFLNEAASRGGLQFMTYRCVRLPLALVSISDNRILQIWWSGIEGTIRSLYMLCITMRMLHTVPD